MAQACSTRHLTAQKQDPTQTKTIRETYASRLRGRFGALSAAIREGVISDDVLGLRRGSPTTDTDRLTDTFAELKAIDAPPDLSTLSEAEQIAQFEAWLNDVEDSEILDIIKRDENVWIRQAYERGLKNADTAMRQAGMAAPEATARELLQLPMHEDRLKSLFARNYAQLDGITNATNQQITRELASGLSEGVSPSEIARRLTDRVDKIGKTRATAFARTESINAHTTATLQRYEQLGVEEVGVEPEVRIETAGDAAVCEQCQAAADRGPWSIEEFRQSPYRPPLHVNCRCTVLPVVSG